MIHVAIGLFVISLVISGLFAFGVAFRGDQVQTLDIVGAALGPILAATWLVIVRRWRL